MCTITEFLDEHLKCKQFDVDIFRVRNRKTFKVEEQLKCLILH